MTRIKVLQVITGLGPGGAERLLLDLAAHMDHSRFDTQIVALSSDVRALDAYGHQNRPVDVFDLSANRWQTLKKLRSHVLNAKPDIIHAHMFHALIAAYASTFGQSEHAPIVFTSHNSTHRMLRTKLIARTKSRRAADVVFSPDQHPALNASRTVIIPNGVPVPEHAPARRPWTDETGCKLLYVGRFEAQKNPLGLVRSFAAADIPGAHLTLVGDGSLRRETEALVAELGLCASVTCLGLRKDIRTLMADADVFIMQSHHEGMPMALLEAGAEAMPVLSTPVGSVPDILADGYGALSDIATYPKALRDLVAAPEAALAMGQRLRARVFERYSIEASAKAHAALYADLMTRRASRTSGP